MNSLLMKKASRAMAWTMTMATSLWLVVPASAVSAATYRYSWVSQTPSTVTADGKAHYVNANAGDTVAMSVTLTNKSSVTIKGKTALGAIPAGKQVQPGAWAIGVRGDAMTPWLDASSFVLNGNRFVYYDGPDVAPGANFTVSWNVKVASTAANGTYDLYFRPVAEYIAWTNQVAWNGRVLSKDKADIFTRFIVGGSTTVTTGNVTVSAGSMPSDQLVPTSASNVRAATWRFTAGSEAATITGLTVKREGVGTVSDISGAYIFKGNDRLTSSRTFNTSTNEASFSGLNISIPASMSVELSLIVDMSSTAGANNQHTFAITANTAIVAGGNVGGSFPINSNKLTIASATAGSVVIEKTGGVNNPTVGDRNVKLSEFRISANTEDAYVKAISLYQGGSVTNTALTNFVLKQNGIQIAATSAINSKGYAVFALSTPFYIERGNNRIFEVYGDVAGRKDDTIKLYVDASVDVWADGGTYGKGMRVTYSNFDSTASRHHVLTLQGGTVTITFNGPATSNVANNANDLIVWRGNITAASNIEVRNWRVLIADTTDDSYDLVNDTDSGVGVTSTAYVQDVKLWNLTNNTVIAGPREFTAVTTNGDDVNSEQLTFTEDYTINAGSTFEIGITVDIRNNPDSAITLRATLGDGTYSFTPDTDLRSVDTNQFLAATDVAPSGVIAGNVQTVTRSSLIVTVAPSPTDNITVQGAQNHSSVAFNFTTGSGSAVKVSSIRLNAYISEVDDGDAMGNGTPDIDGTSSADPNDLIQSISLWDGSTKVGVTKSLLPTGLVTFDNLNWNIPQATTKTLTVKATLAKNVLSNESDWINFAIDSDATNLVITAVDNNSNSVYVTGTSDLNGAGTTADIRTEVKDTGTLTAALHGDTPNSNLQIAGAEVMLAAFYFEAQYESFDVKKFQLISNSNNDRIGTLKVKYPDSTGTTKEATVGLTSVDNWNVNISTVPMRVPVNSDAKLEVWGSLAPFTLLDGTESETIAFTLNAASLSTESQATGFSSGYDTTADWAAADVAGNTHRVNRTNITVAKGNGVLEKDTGNVRGSSDAVAQYTLSTDTASPAYFRGAKKAIDGAITSWAATDADNTVALTTGLSDDSNSAVTSLSAAPGASVLAFDFGASAGLDKYTRVSAWVRITGTAAAGAVTFAVDDTALLASPQGTTSVATASTTPTWYFVDMDVATLGWNANTRYVGVKATSAGGTDTVTMVVDQLVFYNNSINVKVSGNLGAVATTKATKFQLRSGGTTKMVGWFNAASTSAGTVKLIPGTGDTVTAITTTADLAVGSSPASYDLVTNTSTVMAVDTPSVIESLSVAVDTGTVSTAGDFRWYDNSNAGASGLAGYAPVLTTVKPVSSTLAFNRGY